MRRLRAAVFVVVVAVLVFDCPASRVQACGPFIKESVFWWRHLPDLDSTTFARGELGIVSPRFASSYLIVAYRTLSNRTLTEAEAQSVEHMWDVRLRRAVDGNGDADRWEVRWQKERARVTGLAKPPEVNSYSKEGQYFYSRNILADAFKTATETLRERRQRYGARSPLFASWVRAQDLVFAGAPPATVEAAPMPQGAPDIARADRAYQVAAASFYKDAYADARQRFLEIAADAKSPWRRYGTYLAARAALREGGAALDEAQRLFEAVVADPSLAKLHVTAAGLVLRVRSMREAPERLRPELAATILAPRPGPLFGDLVRHLSLAIARGPGKTLSPTTPPEDSNEPELFPGEEPDRSEDYSEDRWRFAGTDAFRAEHDLIDWIVTFQSTDRAAASHALTRWRQTFRPVWLVAAIAGLRSIGASGAPAVVEAAAAIPPTSPAYATVTFHRARLLIDARRGREARPILDAAIGESRLPLGSRNHLRDLRLRTAASVDDLVQDLGVEAVGLRAEGYPEYSSSVADADCGFVDQDVCGDLRSVVGRTQLLPRAAGIIDGLPLSMLTALASDARVADSIRRDLTQAAWVRAIVSGDDEAVRSLAAALSKQYVSVNDSLASELARVAAAENAGDRRFESTWILVRYPVMSPFARPGLARLTPSSFIDNYQDNWWDVPLIESDKRDPDEEGMILRPALFLDVASRRQAIAEHRRLRAAGAAGAFMARAVVEHATTHANDTRLPEALHRAVRATRFAGGGEWSRRAYALLHKQFPESPWAKRTRFWY